MLILTTIVILLCVKMIYKLFGKNIKITQKIKSFLSQAKYSQKLPKIIKRILNSEKNDSNAKQNNSL